MCDRLELGGIQVGRVLDQDYEIVQSLGSANMRTK